MSADLRARIRALTVEARMPLLPELPLRLITEACPLWKGGAAELAEAGLEAPYWAFCWPGGQALARLVLDQPEHVRGKRVLDFGAGGAVEALASLRAGAAHALAADIDPWAGACAEENAARHSLELEVTARDLIGESGAWDVILAGDVFYERALTDQVVHWLRAEVARGVSVLLGDPRRGWLDEAGLERIATYTCAADGDVTGIATKATSVWRL